MSVAELVALRDDVQATLSMQIEKEKADLQKQIDRLSTMEEATAPRKRRLNGGAITRARGGKSAPQKARRSRTSVAPKYRGPKGETWSGRGSAPRWLTALEAEGRKRENFLIKK